MSATDAIKPLLAADAVLMQSLTGGVYTFEALGRSGISRTSLPAAYNPLLKGLAVVKSAGTVVEAAAFDGGAVVVRERIEIFFYGDGDGGFSALLAARARVYVLLHNKTVSGAGRIRWRENADDLRDPTLNNACVLRADYEVVRVQT